MSTSLLVAASACGVLLVTDPTNSSVEFGVEDSLALEQLVTATAQTTATAVEIAAPNATTSPLWDLFRRFIGISPDRSERSEMGIAAA